MSDLLNSASLVMIPSGYKEDTVYSQIPTDGSGDMAFTRASNGTRINSAGLVEGVAWNLVQQSETFDNASWVKSNSTITANNTTAPNGTATADKIAPNGTLTSTFFAVGQSIANTIIGQNYTETIYVKAGTITQMMMYLGSSNGIYWNLSNGQFISYYSGVQNIIAYNSEAIGDGWYKYTITINEPDTTIDFEIYGAKSGAFIGNYTTADNFFIWGAQLNIGATAKPYFPTTDRLNVPRLTYQNGGGGCPSLLLEKQSTNIMLYSEDFSNAAWTVIGTSITSNNTTSPDGTQNADKITEDSSNGLHVVYNTSGVSAGAGTWTMSIFYKKGTRRYFAIKMQIGSSSYTQVYDADGLTTGGSSSNGLTSVSSTIVSMGNGWVRATLTGTDASGGGSGYGIFSLSNSASPSFDPSNFNPTYQGTGTDYGYFWGAQLE